VRILDANDFGAEVGQHHGTQRSRRKYREIESSLLGKGV
jgi:hypothetical protein